MLQLLENRNNPKRTVIWNADGACVFRTLTELEHYYPFQQNANTDPLIMGATE